MLRANMAGLDDTYGNSCMHYPCICAVTSCRIEEGVHRISSSLLMCGSILTL